MNKSIWRVPIICIVAGFSVNFIVIRLLGQFALKTLPDGTITVDPVRELILFGTLSLTVLLIGGLKFLKGLSRKEIFLSSSVTVAYGVILLAAQYLTGLTTGTGAIIFYYLYLPLSWCGDFGGCLMRNLFGSSDISVWVMSIPGLFLPWLFTLFGKRAHT